MNWLITIPPSIAAIVWAAAWLQRERDRKINLAQAAALEAATLANEAQDIQLRDLLARTNENERIISMLSDRHHGS